MRVLVWLVAETWQRTIAEAGAVLGADAEVTLLHVAATDAEGVISGARAGLLGRGPGPPPPPHELAPAAISEEAQRRLLADAAAQLGRPGARLDARRGRIEDEVLNAALDADLLVMARDGDRGHPGPHSVGRQARFVLDHAPCSVLLVWP